MSQPPTYTLETFERMLFSVELLKDVVPGPTGVEKPEIVEAGAIGYLFTHTGTRQLWRTDGTAAGTTAVTSVADGLLHFRQALVCDERWNGWARLGDPWAYRRDRRAG